MTNNSAQSVRILTIFVVVLAVLSAIMTTLFFTKGSLSGDKLEVAVANVLTDKPEIITSAFEGVRKEQAAKAAEAQKKALAENLEALQNDDSNPYFGNKDGDIVIIKFSDYSCGYCKKAMPEIAKVLEQDKNVKIVMKDYPILGPSSQKNAVAALAVYNLDPSKYFKFHQDLLKNTPRSEEQLFAAAEKLGIEKGTLLSEMSKPKYAEILKKNLQQGNLIGVQGTPAFLIGDEFVRGYVKAEQMLQIIADQRGS